MAVDVGQTLDKYELLERVGQGGMAVVYRGRDRSLRREVAVKVLHHHLAEHQEARDRFEREAHAVAKLRHENILEIYDFSGNDSSESYIVTEFIDGESLKEFIGSHTIRYPEIGAMIAIQVCKALQHAHAAGILHRDVKPENIMIRSDGVVKLTDFGIAQMIDLQRLTVTGQLLGSPAYMSPEHVNGGQLDFRTDVFAVGIVLYQLVTGELPFKGKNPHAILKKIAEGDFLDAQVVNPLVGKRLGRIIDKAMARDKEDRYADVSQLLAALEKYLAESGLTGYREELARFFAAPVSYEMALKERLIDHLARSGRAVLESDQLAALELFNRVLTMEPDHAEVLAVIDRLGRRKRTVRIAAILGAAVLAAGFAYGVRAMAARSQGPITSGWDPPRLVAVPEPRDDAAIELAADAGLVPRDAAVTVAADARVRVIDEPDPPRRLDAGAARPTAVDAAAPTRKVVVAVNRFGSEVRVGDGSWRPIDGKRAELEIGPGKVIIAARNESCCDSDSVTVSAAAASGARFTLELPPRPAQVIPSCAIPGVEVLVDDTPGTLGRAQTVTFDADDTAGQKHLTVKFYGPDYSEEVPVSVGYAETRKVPCPGR
jgi:serine/threonine-protein kinase